MLLTRLIQQEANFIFVYYHGEESESVFLMGRMASKALSQKDVPVGLPFFIHMLLHLFSNLYIYIYIYIYIRNTLVPSPSTLNSVQARFVATMASSKISSGRSAGH